MSEVDKKKLLADLIRNLGLGSREEAVAKGISDLTDVEKIELLSNLYPFEDEELSAIYLIGQRYKIGFLKDYVNARLKLRCSVMGWRANQIVAIASEQRREQSRFGFFRRLFKRKEKGLGEVEEFE
jgi:hypothetical protein